MPNVKLRASDQRDSGGIVNGGPPDLRLKRNIRPQPRDEQGSSFVTKAWAWSTLIGIIFGITMFFFNADWEKMHKMAMQAYKQKQASGVGKLHVEP